VALCLYFNGVLVVSAWHDWRSALASDDLGVVKSFFFVSLALYFVEAINCRHGPLKHLTEWEQSLLIGGALSERQMRPAR
jgi:hypothetical protein